MRPYRLFQTVSAVILIAGLVAAVILFGNLIERGDLRGSVAAVVSIGGALVYASVSLIYLSQLRSARLERANAAQRLEMERRQRSEEAVRTLNQELRRRVADFETLLEVIPIGIAVADDPECKNIRVNPALAKMMGVARDLNISKSGPEAAALPYRLLRDGREIPPEELAMQVAARTKAPVIADENRVVRADGSIIDVLNFATPLFDDNGTVRGVLNACVDISDGKAREEIRRELEQRLQRAERRKSLGVMAAGIAHDFNNLLTSIIGQASLASAALPPGHPAANHVALSMEAAERAATLVHQVLAYTGRAHHRLAETCLRNVVEELRAPLTELAAGTADLRFSIPDSLPCVMADPGEIRHMLQHLVRNAIEAMDQELTGAGSIGVTLTCCELTGDEQEMVMHEGHGGAGRYVCVEVKDAAGGMPAEIAERAFDPFFSTKFLGRGMGLSEVLGIMRAHRGAVRMRTVLNAGTSVELFFPVSQKDGTRGD